MAPMLDLAGPPRTAEPYLLPGLPLAPFLGPGCLQGDPCSQYGSVRYTRWSWSARILRDFRASAGLVDSALVLSPSYGSSAPRLVLRFLHPGSLFGSYIV